MRRWTKGHRTIFEYCRWFYGVISILVPTKDLHFDPYVIIKNADNDWKKYTYEMMEGYDGTIDWNYGENFKYDEWQLIATKFETDIREELQKLGWNGGEQELFIEGEIEIDTSETRSVRNNYNLEW